MKYDPDIVSLDIEGMTLAEEGAYSRCVRNLWKIGPLPEERIQRLCGENFGPVKACMKEFPEGWSFPWLEGARNDAIKGRKQRSDAGKKSAELQADDQRPLNGRLSISNSSSISPSLSESGRGAGETMDAEIEPTFAQWWAVYDKSRDKGACEAKWRALGHDVHLLAMEHTRQYVIAQPDKTFRKDPIRYLTKQSWTDEIVTRTTNTTPGQLTREERQRAAVEAVLRDGG